MKPRWRHLKRGSTYTEIGRAELQASKDVIEGMTFVVYRSEKDGKLWIRQEDEFEDGRFERLPSAQLANRDLHDFVTHRRTWRMALEAKCGAADQDGDDTNLSYWEHELHAFDRAFDLIALLVSASPQPADAQQGQDGIAERAASIALEWLVPTDGDVRQVVAERRERQNKVAVEIAEALRARLSDASPRPTISALADRLEKYARDISNSSNGGTQHTCDCDEAARLLRASPQQVEGAPPSEGECCRATDCVLYEECAASVRTIATAIADGFTNGNERYDDCDETKRRNFDAAALAVSELFKRRPEYDRGFADGVAEQQRLNGETLEPFFECPSCGGDIAGDGHKPGCVSLQEEGAWQPIAPAPKDH